MTGNQYLDILTIDQAAKILRIGRNQCYELLQNGQLKAFKLGTKIWKIPRASITDFIRSNGYTR